MIKLTAQEVFSYLKQVGYNPEIQKDSGQILINMSIKNQNIPLFIGLLGENNLLQMLSYLPYKLQSEHLDKIARLLHVFNRKIDLPGFGMDEEYKFLFYRAVFPLITQEASREMLNFYILAIRVTLESFMEGIGAVLSGELSFQEALNKLQI